MTTSAPPPPAPLSREVLGFARLLAARTGARGRAALALQVVGSLTEGLSILLLVPLLRLVDRSGEGAALSVRLPEGWAPGWASAWLPGGGEIGLVPVLALFVGLVALQALFNRYRTILMGDVLQGFVNRVRGDLVRSIAGARWSAFASTRESDLTHALTGDIDRVQAAATALLVVAQSLVMLCVYLAVSLAVSPVMTGVAVVAGGIVLAALHPMRRRSHRFGTSLTARRQEQYRTVSDFLSGMKVAKSLNAEGLYVGRLDDTLERMRVDLRRYTALSTIGTAAFQVASALALAVFVFVALAAALPLPEIVVLLLVYMRVAPRFLDLQLYVQQFLVNLPAFQAIEATKARFDAVPEVPAAAEASGPGAKRVEAPLLSRELRLEGLGFAHGGPEGPRTLADIGFAMPAGTVTALVGPSGAGKSTLADIVLGLLEPDAGRLLVDGVEIGPANRRAWRSRVAFVPQDVFLLHETLAANLRLARPDADEDALWRALGLAQARGFAERLPQGLDTVVGERGTRLSGGERQRVALARALLREPRLLVLDEATSALDGENQALVAEAIAGLKGATTILTIAHRPSMIALADHVVAIEDGRVAESGAFAALAARPGSRLSRILAAEGGGRPEKDEPEQGLASASAGKRNVWRLQTLLHRTQRHIVQ